MTACATAAVCFIRFDMFAPRRPDIPGLWRTTLRRIPLGLVCLVLAAGSLPGEGTPACPSALELGFQHLHEKRAVEAIREFDAFLEVKPEHRMARFGRAAALFDLRRYGETLALLNELLQEDEEDLNALNLRGLTWYHTHRFNQAIRDFQQALKLDPKEAYFYESLAWAYLCAGRPDEASRAALQAYSIYRELDEGPSFSLLIAYFGFRTVGNQREAEKVLQFARNQMDPVSWPFPVVEFFLGSISEDELIVEVESLLQETEARTYIALRNVWENRMEDARMKLGWVSEYGDPGVFEHTFAQVLLRDLPKGP